MEDLNNLGDIIEKTVNQALKGVNEGLKDLKQLKNVKFGPFNFDFDCFDHLDDDFEFNPFGESFGENIGKVISSTMACFAEGMSSMANSFDHEE